MKLTHALAFLTRLPVGKQDLKEEARGQNASGEISSLHGFLGLAPLVGLIIGTILGTALFRLHFLFPTSLSPLMACLIWCLLTGGLHLDGLVDSADGLFAETSKERRLEIMKDPRLGAYAGISLFFVLALKSACLAIILNKTKLIDSQSLRLGSLLFCLSLATVLARSLIVLVIKEKNVRKEGLGPSIKEGLSEKDSRSALLFGLVFFLIFCLFSPLFGLSFWQGFFSLALAIMGNIALVRAAKKRLGGLSGDIFGCSIELVECLVLLGLCASL